MTTLDKNKSNDHTNKLENKNATNQLNTNKSNITSIININIFLVFVLTFIYLLCSLLIFFSYDEKTARDILSNYYYSIITSIIAILAMLAMIFHITMIFNELKKNVSNFIISMLVIIVLTALAVWLDLQADPPETKIMFFKFLSKLIEFTAIASAVSFLNSYHLKPKSEKSNVLNQNINTKQTADSEKSESKNEQADNTTENNQTDTTKPEPEQSSEEKESPHG